MCLFSPIDHCVMNQVDSCQAWILSTPSIHIDCEQVVEKQLAFLKRSLRNSSSWEVTEAVASIKQLHRQIHPPELHFEKEAWILERLFLDQSITFQSKRRLSTSTDRQARLLQWHDSCLITAKSAVRTLLQPVLLVERTDRQKTVWPERSQGQIKTKSCSFGQKLFNFIKIGWSVFRWNATAAKR